MKQYYGTNTACIFYDAQKSTVGAGSDTWFISCSEGKYVIKYSAGSAINHPEAEPELCAFLLKNGIPACDFLKNRHGEYLTADTSGRLFTLQRRYDGITPQWHSASETLLTESAEMLGKIHSVLKDYPKLPEGIGENFFKYMTPQNAIKSYKTSLETAVCSGDKKIIGDLKWRIDFTARLPDWKFDLDKLTLGNTHGDYFISQFLCKNGHLNAVIDWTTACVHPVIWEITRSFVYGAQCCADGKIDEGLLENYLKAYSRYSALNDYDLENPYRLYFYQIAVCDYCGQYFSSRSDNREIYLKQAEFATLLLKETADTMLKTGRI